MVAPCHRFIFMLFMLVVVTCLAVPACTDAQTCSGSVEDQDDDYGSLLHLKTLANSSESRGQCGSLTVACPTGCEGPCTPSCQCANNPDISGCSISCGSGGGGKTKCPPKPCPQDELPGECVPDPVSGSFCASGGPGQECSMQTCPHGYQNTNGVNDCEPHYGVPQCPGDGTCPSFSAIRQAGYPPIMQNPLVSPTLNLACAAACQCNADGVSAVPPCTIPGDDEGALTGCYCSGKNVALDFDNLDSCGFATAILPPSSGFALVTPILPRSLAAVSEVVADEVATCPGSGIACAGDQCCPGIALTGNGTFACPLASRNYDRCQVQFALCPGSGNACSGNECCPGIPESGGSRFPCPIADPSYTGCGITTVP